MLIDPVLISLNTFLCKHFDICLKSFWPHLVFFYKDEIKSFVFRTSFLKCVSQYRYIFLEIELQKWLQNQDYVFYHLKYKLLFLKHRVTFVDKIEWDNHKSLVIGFRRIRPIRHPAFHSNLSFKNQKC